MKDLIQPRINVLQGALRDVQARQHELRESETALRNQIGALQQILATPAPQPTNGEKNEPCPPK